MIYADPIQQQFASGQFYESSSYPLSPDKLESDYSPVRFNRELRIFRKFCASGATLDVGCSTGAFLYHLERTFPHAYSGTGMDVAGSALNYAKTRGINVIPGHFLNQALGSTRFDAITLWAVVEHLAAPRLFLTKAADLLREGGHCFILVPNMRSFAVRLLRARYRYIMPEHVNYFTPETLKRFAQTERRFTIQLLESTHFNPAVIWQDWRSGGMPATEFARARLLRKTTALKQSALLAPAKVLYQTCEAFLNRFLLADNLVVVLKHVAKSAVA